MQFTKYRSMPVEAVKEELLNRIAGLLPQFKIKQTTTDWKNYNSFTPDLIVEIELDGIQKTLLIEIKSIGEPKIVKNAIFQLRKFTSETPGVYPVFAAPYISERSRELCIEEGVGYMDLAGNVYLHFNSVLIDKTARDSIKIERGSNRSIFSTKATRVLRVLLENPQDEMKIKDLSQKCDMSPAGVYYVLNELESKGYIERTESKGARLIEPERLLTDWGKNWNVEKSRSVRYFSFARSAQEIIGQIRESADKFGLKYALTGMAGASMVSPFVRFNEVWLYLSEKELEKLVVEMDLRPVDTGANVVVFVPYDKGVFLGERNIKGTRVVSNVQLYIDLYSSPARGEEQAQRILETQLDFRGD